MHLNGTLISQDIELAKIENGQLQVINETLLPLYLKRTGNLEGWLEGRAIDKHRTNSRLLKKALRLTTADDVDVVLYVNAATITDTYWIKPAGSNMTYNDIRFNENMFDKLALYGDPDSFNQPEQPTPELTNIGSFEKCWRLIDGAWWMYKQGNETELFSELFIYTLGKALGFPMAEYQLDGPYIRSRDFTQGASVNYEPMDSLVGSEEDYCFNFNTILKHSKQVAQDYVVMVYLDTLCFNMDRHTKNYGLLRDINTGEVLRLAPNFDNNIALIARGYPKNAERTNDRLIALFVEFINSNPKARESFEQLDMPPITEGLIKDCIAQTEFTVDIPFLCRFILNGQQKIVEYIEQTHTRN